MATLKWNEIKEKMAPARRARLLAAALHATREASITQLLRDAA